MKYEQTTKTMTEIIVAVKNAQKKIAARKNPATINKRPGATTRPVGQLPE